MNCHNCHGGHVRINALPGGPIPAIGPAGYPHQRLPVPPRGGGGGSGGGVSTDIMKDRTFDVNCTDLEFRREFGVLVKRLGGTVIDNL